MDQLPQPYHPYPLAQQKAVERLFTTQKTILVRVPGYPYPVPLIVPQRRWWPVVLGVCGVLGLGGFFVIRLLLPVLPTVTARVSPLIQPCVPDRVWLVFSQVKDRVEVWLDGKLFKTIREGDFVTMTGKVDRSLGGPGVGVLDLSSHLPTGTHDITLLAFHEKGDTAGAMVELRKNDTQLRTFTPGLKFRTAPGKFGEETITVTTSTCSKEL